ncbi:MAG: hypothetical protein WDW38_009624 [Sanguina aurantia]
MSAANLHVLSDKYDIPVLHKLARRALLHSLRPLAGDAAAVPRGTLDPWALAHRACQFDDSELLRRCMATVCEPLEKGGCICPLSVNQKAALSPMVCELVSEVNKAVAGIPVQLAMGEASLRLCASLTGERDELKERCAWLESTKAEVKLQLKNLRKRCYTQMSSVKK